MNSTFNSTYAPPVPNTSYAPVATPPPANTPKPSGPKKPFLGIYLPTKIMIVSFLLVLFILVVRPQKYDPDTGEKVTTNAYDVSQLIGIAVFCLFSVLAIYSINCLSLQHHLASTTTALPSGNVFSANAACLTRDNINQLFSKALNPDKKCEIIAYIFAIAFFVLSVLVFIIGFMNKFIRKTTKSKIENK
jgi:hypothetical protein